jgi:hypothetical protein
VLTADWSVTISVFTGKVKKIKIICILDLLTEMDWNKQITEIVTDQSAVNTFLTLKILLFTFI